MLNTFKPTVRLEVISHREIIESMLDGCGEIRG